MLAFLIAVSIVPILIVLGVEASKWHFLSRVASRVLDLLPYFMVLWYFSIDETINCIVYRKGKVLYEQFPKIHHRLFIR